MNGKRYFNEIKKEMCLHQLFSKLHIIIFLQSHHALQYTAKIMPLLELTANCNIDLRLYVALDMPQFGRPWWVNAVKFITAELHILSKLHCIG